MEVSIRKEYLQKKGIDTKKFYAALDKKLKDTDEIYYTNGEKFYFLAGYVAGFEEGKSRGQR